MKYTGFDLYENIFIMAAALLLLILLLLYTRSVRWTPGNRILLFVYLICYVLDTVWWWFGLHYRFTDICFLIGGYRFKLSVFFVLSAASLLALAVSRIRRRR